MRHTEAIGAAERKGSDLRGILKAIGAAERKGSGLRDYERPGYEATFLAALEQRAEIAISFCKQF